MAVYGLDREVCETTVIRVLTQGYNEAEIVSINIPRWGRGGPEGRGVTKDKKTGSYDERDLIQYNPKLWGRIKGNAFIRFSSIDAAWLLIRRINDTICSDTFGGNQTVRQVCASFAEDEDHIAAAFGRNWHSPTRTRRTGSRVFYPVPEMTMRGWGIYDLKDDEYSATRPDPSVDL